MGTRALYLLISLFLLIGCEKKQNSVVETSGFIEINSTQHYYDIAGKGDTLVVLHGGTGVKSSIHETSTGFPTLLSIHFTLL